MVSICDTGCKIGIGDLIGGPLWVGVDATWPVTRNWPTSDPSFVRSQAQPPERRSVATAPTSVAVAPTIGSVAPPEPMAAQPSTTIAGTTPTNDESIGPAASAPAAAPADSGSGRSAIIAASAAAAIAGGAVVVMAQRRSRRNDARRAAIDARRVSCGGGGRPARPASASRQSCRRAARTRSDRAARPA